MSKDQDRSVYRRSDGAWVNKRNDADKASSVHQTQGNAWDTARAMLRHQGGGELTVMGRRGVIVSKDTIARPDPVPPKDKEH